jgi:predicted AAA+ superfamily ATPase
MARNQPQLAGGRLHRRLEGWACSLGVVMLLFDISKSFSVRMVRFMHRRTIYLDRIRRFLGKPVVKVITGMRRVGKSYLVRQIIDLLHEDGVGEGNILYVDMESLDFEHIETYRDLYAEVERSLLRQPGMKYLLVDEVQEIAEWERAVASLVAREDVDIVITGSNAHLFSSELSTRLSGRYVEFPLYALGFSEYLQFRGDRKGDVQSELLDYLRFGGLPAIHHFELDEEMVYQYVSSIYNTILLKDIVRRHGVRNVELLERIARYLFDNVGNVTSAKSIADFVKSQRLRVGVETVQHYLGHFQEALVAHRVQRYDLKGKRLLELLEKYYLGDIGIRHAVLGYREGDIGGVLENIVFLELLRRGYTVSVGKLGDREVDFIATKEKTRLYVQVAYLLASRQVVEREFGVLRDIPDNYPKLVVSMDTAFGDDVDGIRRLNLADFLLEAW